MSRAIYILPFIVMAMANPRLAAGQTSSATAIISSCTQACVDTRFCIQKSELKKLEKRAEKNDLVALREIHNYYEAGCEDNERKLLYYGKKAAEVGTSYDVKVYAEDLAGFKGDTAAFPFFLMAARLGDLDAIGKIANAYLYGRGTKKDITKARRWLELEAKRGCIHSMYQLAYLLSESSTPLDREKAMAWLLTQKKIFKTEFHTNFNSKRAKHLMDKIRQEIPSNLSSTVKLISDDYEYTIGSNRCVKD